jgi:hypothetical protein
MGDHLFQRVGHTDEGTASLGGNPALWSPFHPDYSPRNGRLQQAAEARTMAGQLKGGMRTNPPTATPAVAKALDYAAARLKAAAAGDIESVFSSHTVLALGGFIVNRSWGEALALCNRMISYATKAGKIKVMRAPGAKPKAMLMTDASSGIYAKLKAVQQYLVCLDAGREPVRKGKKGRPINLFDDVRDCCIVETGNVKLPFVAYSEIPVVTCPGAGGVSRFPQLHGNALGTAKITENGAGRTGCATFCYSLKVFGKPSVVFRMLINTLGFSADPARHVNVVVEEVVRTKKKILRLFVDGDFRSTESVWFWMNAIKILAKHGVNVYGYSKSWEEFLEANRHYNANGDFWPRNYALNLSGGSRHSAELRGQMKRVLDWRNAGGVVRGEFNAVQVLERLCWKAAGLSQGEAIWSAFTRATDGLKTSDAKFKAARHRMVEQLRSINPAMVEAYDDYVRSANDIDTHVRGYNVFVAKRVKSAKAAQPLQLAPGQAAQALTWKLLQLIKQPDEFSCPISCGSCPRSMIRQHDATISNLFGGKNADVLANMRTAQVVTAEMSSRAEGSGTVHACGDQRIRKSIIIGLH